MDLNIKINDKKPLDMFGGVDACDIAEEFGTPYLCHR